MLHVVGSLALLYFVGSIESSLVNGAHSLANEALAAGQACGAAGYVLDAPIPEVMGKEGKSRRRRAATTQKFNVWPNGEIPYVFDESFSDSSRQLVLKAMKHWESETCVKFVTRKNQPDYINIYQGTGCCSHVGRRGGKQFLSLGKGCLRFGIITHELGHVVGFWHEQNRPDRSIYIDILYDNVDSSKYLNFDPRGSNEVDTFDQVYDYQSIMHYGTRFFSKNDGKTIRAKTVAGQADNAIGKSYYKFDGPVLSTQDILETNLLYKCTKITDCGGTLFATKGSFTSSNFPSSYQTDVKHDCIWIITTTQPKEYQGKTTSLTLFFEHFNVGNEKSRKTGQCEDDYVEVREGKGFLSPYIVRYCGNKLPSPITTTSGSLYVRFHTSGKNKNVEGKLPAEKFTGFQVEFKTDSCSHHIKKFPTKIKSPFFPFAYKKGQDCLWVIEANKGMQVELDFPFFSLRELDNKDGCLDYVEIHEGDGNSEQFIGRFCGTNSPKKIITSMNQIKIHFHANKKQRLGWYMGFQANIRQKDIDECKLGIHSCTQACLNYPGGYFCGCYGGYHTVYQKDSRKAECVDKDECSINNGGCSHTCVNTDGSYICSCPEGYTLSANKTTCIDIDECMFEQKPCSHFCTNVIGGYECTCKDGYLLQSDNKTCSSLPGCMTRFRTAIGRIASPVIPLTYRHDVKCTWRVDVPPHLKVALTLEVPWANDDGECSNHLLIHNDKYERKHGLNTKRICSQNDGDNTITMERNTAIIDYFVKSPYPPNIAINYHSVSSKKQHCGKVFNITHGRFRTTGYPYKYPDSENCVWTIHSPNSKPMKLRFIHFGLEEHTECEFDYVDVEEHFYNMPAVKKIGRFCGNRTPPKMLVDGSKSYFKVKFHSDETMGEKGFKAVFKEVEK